MPDVVVLILEYDYGYETTTSRIGGVYLDEDDAKKAGKKWLEVDLIVGFYTEIWCVHDHSS